MFIKGGRNKKGARVGANLHGCPQWNVQTCVFAPGQTHRPAPTHHFLTIILLSFGEGVFGATVTALFSNNCIDSFKIWYLLALNNSILSAGSFIS
jgi:hypothetical protein